MTTRTPRKKTKFPSLHTAHSTQASRLTIRGKQPIIPCRSLRLSWNVRQSNSPWSSKIALQFVGSDCCHCRQWNFVMYTSESKVSAHPSLLSVAIFTLSRIIPRLSEDKIENTNNVKPNINCFSAWNLPHFQNFVVCTADFFFNRTVK